MESNSKSLRGALLSWLGRGQQNEPEETANVGTETDVREGPSEQVAPSSNDPTTDEQFWDTSSGSPTVPIYDAGRKRCDLLRRLEALAASGGTGGGSAPPHPPPGFDSFHPDNPEPRFTPQLLDRMWDMPTRKPVSDCSYLTAGNESTSPSSLSFRQWRSVGQDATMSASATSIPSQSSSSAMQWQYVRLPQVDLDMSDFRPFLDLPSPGNRAQSLNPPQVSRGPTDDFYDRFPTGTASGAPQGSQLSAPKPSLKVFPERLINFANCHITFSVQAINIPADVPLASCKVEGVAVTPSGIPIQCQLRELKKTTIYQMDFFNGFFTSEDEVGLYKLKVRVILPFNPQWDAWMKVGMGVIIGEAEILVSRNYYKQSLVIPARSFQVEFTPWHYVQRRNERKQGTFMTSEEAKAGCLSKAWGLTVDKLTNRFYYTDRNSNSLSCLDAEGRVIFRIPQPGFNSKLCRPAGICCDEAHRRLIIADKDNHRVAFFSMDGEFLTSFGSRGHGPGQFNYPWDVAVSPGGDRIVVTDSRNKRIQLFDTNGMYLNRFSVFEHSPYDYTSQFDYPRGVTFNKDGTSIFVTDFNSNNILEVPLSMQMFRRVLPERKLQRPQGILVDELDNLLLCDSKNMCIRHVYPAKGQVLSTIHTVGNERLQFPVNLALMGDGRLAVLGSQGTIRIF